jgi:hypothetical protein
MLAELGLDPEENDHEPPLHWEQPIWLAYAQLSRQLRWAEGQVVGFDLNCWWPLIKAKGWQPDIALMLISNLEATACQPPQIEE